MSKILMYLYPKNSAGGPQSVGYNYYIEMLKRNEQSLTFLPLSGSDETTKKRNSSCGKIINKLRLYIRTILFLYTSIDLRKVPNFDDFDYLFFHRTDDLYIHRKRLASYKGKVFLQSHSPMPLGQELYVALPTWIRRSIPFIKKRYARMDRIAFLRADYIIFPCPEAEEPYYNRWKEYSRIHKIKENSYRYLTTGIVGLKPVLTRSEICAQNDIPMDDFVITYIGRHNEVKGFDILKNIAGEFFNINKHSWIISAGKEEPIKRLEHPRWKEIGFVKDAASYISASDVFILPNRETYFDIVMLEALSLGAIVVASRTGGNKYFEKHGCKGVFLYDTQEDCVNILKRISEMPVKERSVLKEYNIQFFNRYLTSGKMYERLQALLRELD